MAKKSTAPAPAANADDDLPMTGVKERRSTQVIRDLQNQLSQYEPEEPVPVSTPEPKADVPASNDPWEKRYGDLRRHSQKLQDDANKRIKNLEEQLGQMQSAANQPMPRTKEEFEAWKAKYPDIVPFIEMLADEKASARTAKLEGQIQELTGKLSETEEDKAQAQLYALVPDIEAILASEPFKKWFKDQPHRIQDIIKKSDDPEEVAYYLNIYKQLAGKNVVPKPKKGEQLDALAVNVRGSASGPDKDQKTYRFTTSQIRDMKPHEFEKNEAAIDEAERLGLILDDLSRKTYHTDV